MSQTVPPEQSHKRSPISSEYSEAEPQVKRPTPAPKKRGLFSRMSPRMRATIGVIVIALAVVGAFLGPKDSGSDSENVLGDPATTPTVVVSNVVGNVTFKHSVTVQDVHFTFTRATEASNFSDDLQRGGNYTVRVYVSATNTSSAPAGVLYNQIVRLTLPDGQSVAPKYISVAPNMLPKQTQVGFLDFPLSSQMPLNPMMLHIGNETIPLS
jgi:hypothetical protein